MVKKHHIYYIYKLTSKSEINKKKVESRTHLKKRVIKNLKTWVIQLE